MYTRKSTEQSFSLLISFSLFPGEREPEPHHQDSVSPGRGTSPSREELTVERINDLPSTTTTTTESVALTYSGCSLAQVFFYYYYYFYSRPHKWPLLTLVWLPPQNFKAAMETDELQRRIAELCDINTDLQVPPAVRALRLYHYYYYYCTSPILSLSLCPSPILPSWPSAALQSTSASLPSSQRPSHCPRLSGAIGRTRAAVLYSSSRCINVFFPSSVLRCRFTRLTQSSARKKP